MIYKPAYFELDELVCRHVHDKFGDAAWGFMDPRLLKTIDFIRERLNKPVFVNNWKDGGQFSQRGLRCSQCQMIVDAVSNGKLYCSPHIMGQAVDFDVQGLVAEEVRQWIVKNQAFLPFPVRLEAGVSWVHLDVRDADKGKVYLFNA